MAIIGSVAIFIAGLAYKFIREREAHTPLWILTYLSLMNLIITIGGYCFIKFLTIPVIIGCLILGFFILRKAHIIRRLALSFIFISYIGIHILPNYTRIHELEGRCEKDNAQLDDIVEFVDHSGAPYDFLLINEVRSGEAAGDSPTKLEKPLLLSANGRAGEIHVFDADSGKFLMIVPLPNIGQCERLTQSRDKAMVYAPPGEDGVWGEKSCRF